MPDVEQQLTLYRLLVEKSLGLMCIHDLDGVLLAINPAVGRSLGFRPEEGLGRNLRDFLAAAVQPLFDDYLRRIRTKGADSGLAIRTAAAGAPHVSGLEIQLVDDAAYPKLKPEETTGAIWGVRAPET